jgi:hypothetical protein
VEAALLFRHLTKIFPAAFDNQRPTGGLLTHIAMSLNNTLGKNRYVLDGLDQLQNLLDLESTVLKSPSAAGPPEGH